MVNIEAANVLVECSKHIARWAKKGDVTFDEATPAQARAQENAWKLLVHLVAFAEHVKESDLYWKLLHLAERDGKPAKEQARLRTIAKREDRGYMRSKEDLERSLAEMLQKERDDPKASRAPKPKLVKAPVKPAAEKATGAVVSKAAKSSNKTSRTIAKVATKKAAPAKKAAAVKRRVGGAKR